MKNPQDFDLVRRKGDHYSGDMIVIGVYDRGDGESSRFGFVVSQKVSKLASVRNKVKRALREAVRQQTNYFKTGLDIVIVAFPETARAYTDEIMKDIELTFRKAGILK